MVTKMKTITADEQQLIEGLKQLDREMIDAFVNQFSRPLFGVNSKLHQGPLGRRGGPPGDSS